MSTHALQLKVLKYTGIAKVSYRHATAYTGDVISLGILAAVRLWILTQLYFLAYNTAGTSNIGGFTPAMTLWSLAFTNSFQLGIGSRMILQPLAEEIQTGNIAYTLNKPYSFLSYLYFSHLGRLLARLIPTLVIAIGVIFFFAGPIPLSLPGLLAGALLALIGLSINLFLIFIIGLLGFWLEEVKPYRWILDRTQWVLGGMVIPLTFFPDNLRNIAELLPFAAMYYFPARIFVNYNPSTFLKYLAIQTVWLVVSVLIMIWLFRKGVKNISINGG